MGKWLWAGGLVVLVLVLLLWREMQPTGAEATLANRDQARTAVTEPVAAQDTGPATLDPSDAARAHEPDEPDEPFAKRDETIPKVLTRNAAKCYEGHPGARHPDQKLSLGYKVQVASGQVQIRDVAIKESTLGDAALETCLVQAVQRSTWRDDQLPDLAIDDELVLRPERGMKKFWQDNLDYAGAEAPRQ